GRGHAHGAEHTHMIWLAGATHPGPFEAVYLKKPEVVISCQLLGGYLVVKSAKRPEGLRAIVDREGSLVFVPRWRHVVVVEFAHLRGIAPGIVGYILTADQGPLIDGRPVAPHIVEV